MLRKFLFLALCLAMAYAFIPMPLGHADESNLLDDVQQIYVKIKTPFVVGEDSVTSAEFVDMPDSGVEFGLQNMELLGQVSAQAAADESVTGVIKWTALRSTGSDQVTKTLKEPLTSEFTAEPEESVAVGEKLLAIGNLEVLANDIVKLDEETQDEEPTTSEEKTTSVSGITPASSPTSSSAMPSTEEVEIKTDPQTTTYEDCDNFIDEGALKVYQQRKTVVTGESGTVYSTSLCENYATWAEIKKKAADCGYQFNFEEGLAYELEQWYYIDPTSGEEVPVGECRQSGTTYPIVETCGNSLCEDYYDEPNALVFPQCAKGIMVGETWISAPSGCQPNDSESYPVLWEYVINDNGTADDTSDDFIVTHDDYTNGISYPMIRKYYDHPTKGKVYLTEAVQSATESYPHLHETSLCGWVMDDENLQAQQLSNTYIETSMGTRELQECAARTAPVPYAYLGIEDITKNFKAKADNAWQTWTPPAGVTKLKATVVGAGDYGPKYTFTAGDFVPVGGKAGQVKANRTITIADGEAIPLYVGKGGFFTSAGSQGTWPEITGTLYKWTETEAENSVLGKASSSFTVITALAGATASTYAGTIGTSPRVYEGGEGAPGYDIGDGYQAQAGERSLTERGYFGTFPNTYSIWFGQGGPGGVGYGAGGGAAGGSAEGPGLLNRFHLRGGRGANGLIQLTYQRMRYLRPDGTNYLVIYNGN